MKRRALLSAVAASTVGATSGCGGSGGSATSDVEDGSTTSNVDGRSTPADVDGIARVSLASVDRVRNKHNVELSAEMEQQTVTEAHTASVVVSMKNRSSWYNAYYGHILFFWEPYKPADPTISLHDSFRSHPRYKVSERCWKPDDKIRYGDHVKRGKLPPGESVSDTVKVWGNRNNPDGVCLPSGTFSVHNEYEAADRQNTVFSWGFELEIIK